MEQYLTNSPKGHCAHSAFAMHAFACLGTNLCQLAATAQETGFYIKMLPASKEEQEQHWKSHGLYLRTAMRTASRARRTIREAAGEGAQKTRA